MKLLFAITLLLVLSQAQESTHTDHDSNGNPPGEGGNSGGGSGCDAASDFCASEFETAFGCSSDECAADMAWM